MKNINKILGVVLTLAILAGSLVMAVPVSAGTNAWTDFVIPQVFGGTDANIYTVAADGKTMYLWTPIQTNVTALQTDNATLTVSSTVGFPSAGSITVVTKNDPPTSYTWAYTSTSATTFKGLAMAGTVPAITSKVVPAAGTNAALVYKSTDGGRTWVADNLLPPTSDGSTGGPVAPITAIKVAPTATDNLIATDGTNLYRSLNGSKTWFKMASANEIMGANVIYSIDIVDNSGIEILVGTDLGVGCFVTNNGIWKASNLTLTKNLGRESTSGGGAFLNGKVYAVAFAPNYTTSAEILAVENYDNNTYLRTYIQKEKAWDIEVKAATLKCSNEDNITAIDGASLAFPSDFDFSSSSYNKVYVGIKSANYGDVYRVNGVFSGVSKVYDLQVDASIASVAYSGTANNGTVIVGLANTDNAFNNWTCCVVKTSTDADTATSPTWNESNKNPYGTGGDARVFLTSTGDLLVGTRGGGSALYKATDNTFTAFNGIGMIDVPDLGTMTFAGGVPSMQTAGGFGGGINYSHGNPSVNYPKFMQFLRNAAGQHELIFQSNVEVDGAWGGAPYMLPGGVMMAPLKTTDTNLARKLLKSIDGGNSWFYVTTPVPADYKMTALKVINADLYWVGYTGYIRSNTGPAIALPASVGNPTGITFTGPAGDYSKILLTCDGGTYIYSTDSGATWAVLGNVGQWPAASRMFAKYLPVGSDQSIWVVDTNWDIYKWTLGTSTTWELTQLGTVGGLPSDMKTAGITYSTTPPPPPAVGNPIKDFFVGNGVYFFQLPTNTFGQVWRNVGKTGADWRPVAGTEYTATGAKGKLDGGPFKSDADGSFTYEPGIVMNPLWYTPTNGMTWSKSASFTDTIGAAPALVTPAANAEVNLPINFAFTSKYTGDLVNYQLQIARDTAFTLDVKNFTDTALTKVNPFPSLETGVKYYWRVRINGAKGDGVGLMSKWSEVRTLTLKTIGIVNASGIGNPDFVSPRTGQTGVPTLPVLTWGVVAGATYNVQIASDPTFNQVIDMGSALTGAVWSPTKPLDNNKTYFWRVQAVAGGINSDWVAFAFTTAAPPAPPVTQAPPPAVTQAPAPPQTVVVPTPVINVPAATVNVNVPTQGPAPAPATPAYIWVIIVIGAVLVVAVVVLIVRTRRV